MCELFGRIEQMKVKSRAIVLKLIAMTVDVRYRVTVDMLQFYHTTIVLRKNPVVKLLHIA